MLDGSHVSVLKLNEDLLLDQLPARIYSVQFNALTGFYLQTVKDELEIPERIYGTTMARVEKCMETYVTRDASTGILLTGDKGTGKTLLMSVLANSMIEHLNMPVILIKEAYAGNQFTSFIETIGECVLVFDEFGKMYAANDRHNGQDDVPQKALLSLMDGVDKTKRMIILTENSEVDINEFMLNRPSRIYYHFKYKKLDEASVIGYCEDNDVKADVVTDIIELARRSKIFSFDMLQSIVEEHLRFDGKIDEITADLNIDTREDRGAMMEITKIIDRKTDKERKIFGSAFVNKPSMHNYVYIKVANEETEGTQVAPDMVMPERFEHDSPELAAAIKAANGLTPTREEDDGYDEIYVQDRDLAYEKDKELVYETEDFIFVAKAQESPTSQYWKLF